MQTETMRLGDVRVFKPKKSIVLAVGVWAKRQGKYLRIDITGKRKKAHTTVESKLPHAPFPIDRALQTR